MQSDASLSALPEVKTIWNKNFICAVLANLLLCLGHFSVNTHVATYATFLGAAPVIMGLVTGMFFGISLMLKPIAGPAMTKIDKRKLLIVVFIIGGISNVGYALFHDLGMFILFRVFNGIQYGFVGSLIMTISSDNVPKEKMASGMGIYGVGGAIGTAVGPSIGSWLFEFGARVKTEDYGYTLLFLFAAVVLFVAVIPCIILQPDKKTKEQVASTGAWYKNIVTVHAVPTTIIIFFVFMSYAIYNSYIFNLGEELNIENISLFYAFMACTLIISRPLSGLLSDRLGVTKVIVPGLLMFAASFIIIGFSTTIGSILVGGVLAALGIGFTQPAVQAMCMQTAVPLRRSVASNTMYIGMDSGLFVGPLLGSVVYDHSSYALTFKLSWIPAILALIAFVIILPIHKKRRAELEQLGK